MERTTRIYSCYDPPPGVDTVNLEPSLTQQHFADECDINNIIERYVNTGVLGDPLNPGSVSPQFGDFSTSYDFHAAQTLIVQAEQAFDALPAAIRNRFHNDPGELLAFLEDESNREEAINLGIVQRDVGTGSGGTGNTVPAGEVSQPPAAE